MPFPDKLLQLNSISLVRFKNYQQQEFRFSSRAVGVCGPNGAGKTNLLDAIFYLCFTKSYFGRTDALNAHAGTGGFRIEGHFTKNGEPLKAVCVVRETGRKEFLVNDSACEKFADHIGRLPCVIVAPDDVRIISEGSEERRRYIDAILCQLSADYLQRLMNYNRILQQRNSCLKSMSENRIRDPRLLEVYDEQLIADGIFLFEKRQSFLEHCSARITELYREISGNLPGESPEKEQLELRYDSQLLQTRFPELLAKLREKDLLLGRTNGGIHKDDLQITLNRQPFKTMASQGQRKSLLFALKLAEFDMLEQDKGYAPLLLLDDVFEKLDAQRMHNLLDRVCIKNTGQIFITDTHEERIARHFDQLAAGHQLIRL